MVNKIAKEKTWSHKTTRVLYALALCLDKEPTFEGAKQMVADPKFIQNLYEIDLIKKSRIFHIKLDKFIHQADFNLAHMITEGIAVAIFADWVNELHQVDVHKNLEKYATTDNIAVAKDKFKKCTQYNEQFDKFVTKHKRAKSQAKVYASAANTKKMVKAIRVGSLTKKACNKLIGSRHSAAPTLRDEHNYHRNFRDIGEEERKRNEKALTAKKKKLSRIWTKTVEGATAFDLFMGKVKRGERLSYGELRSLNPMTQTAYCEHILLKCKKTDNYVKEVRNLVSELEDEIV